MGVDADEEALVLARENIMALEFGGGLPAGGILMIMPMMMMGSYYSRTRGGLGMKSCLRTISMGRWGMIVEMKMMVGCMHRMVKVSVYAGGSERSVGALAL